MSESCSLPSPIHDPSTGKTFVAIRAPSFIFKNNANITAPNENRGFVYVEKSDGKVQAKPGRMFAPDRMNEEQKPSVDKWMVRFFAAYSITKI